QRNVLVSVRFRDADRLLHLRVNRTTGRAERVLRSDKISNRQRTTLGRGRDVRLVHPPAEIVRTDNRGSSHRFRVTKQNSPKRVSRGLESGDEILILAAILLRYVLHNRGDAVHVKLEWTIALNPVPHLVRIVICLDAARARAAISNDEWRHENEWLLAARVGERSSSLRKLAVCAIDHHDDLPLLSRDPTVRK